MFVHSTYRIGSGSGFSAGLPCFSHDTQSNKRNKGSGLGREPAGLYSLTTVQNSCLSLPLLLKSSRVEAPTEEVAGIQHNT